MEGKIGGILIGVAIAVGIVWFQYSNKDSREQDLRDAAYAMFEAAPDARANAEVYSRWFERHHDACFDRNYTMGSRRRSSSFDETGYWQDLFDAMIAEANREQRTDLIDELRRMRLHTRSN